MLKLKYKKIPDESVKAMKEAVDSNHDYYNDAITEIQKIFHSNETHILNSANSCIFTIVEAIPEPILITDEGGWNGIERSARILNKNILKMKTNLGIIDVSELDKFLSENDVGSLFITSFSGYTAKQDVAKIHEICQIHDVLLIIDISGSIGDEELSNVKYADVQISSTGSPKIVNIRNGGFINNISQKIKFNNHLLKSLKADNITCAGIAATIHNSNEVYAKTLNANMYLKEKLVAELKNDSIHNVIHGNSLGINIIISEESKSKAKKLAYIIRNEINIKNNKSIITTGPNYNRIKRPCVCIETKNIDIDDLTKENMDKLVEIIIKSIKNNAEENN